MDVEKKLSCSLDELIKKQRHDNLKGKKKQQDGRKNRAIAGNGRKSSVVNNTATKDRQLQKHRGSGARSLPAELWRRQPKVKSYSAAANLAAKDGNISKVSSRNRNRWSSRKAVGISASEVAGIGNSPRALLNIRRTGIPGKQLQGRTASSVLRTAIPELSRRAARRALAGGVTAGEIMQLSRRAERRRFLELEQLSNSRGNRGGRAAAMADRLSLRLNTSLNRQRLLRAKRQIQIAQESVNSRRFQEPSGTVRIGPDAQYWSVDAVGPQRFDGTSGRRIVTGRSDKRGKLVSTFDRSTSRKNAVGSNIAAAVWRRSPNGIGNKSVSLRTRATAASRNAESNVSSALPSHQNPSYDAVYNSANTGFRRVRRNAVEFKERAISGRACVTGDRYAASASGAIVAGNSAGLMGDHSNGYGAYDSHEMGAVPAGSNCRDGGTGTVNRYSQGTTHERGATAVDYRSPSRGPALLCDSTSEERHSLETRLARRQLGNATQQSRQRGNSDSLGEKLSGGSSHASSAALAASMGIPPSLLDKIKIVAELNHIPGPLRAQCGGTNETLPWSLAVGNAHSRNASAGSPSSGYEIDGASSASVPTVSARHVTPNPPSFADPFYRPGGVTLSERFGGRRTVM